MPEMDNQNLQILREIDKLDRIGLDGVCKMLGDGMRDASGAFNKGVGLMPIQVEMVRLFFKETTGGTDNDETLAACRRSMGRLGQIRARIDMMALLEETQVSETETAWDRLLAMRVNEDETWNNDGRPKNIAWALDDMVKAARARASARIPDDGLLEPR